MSNPAWLGIGAQRSGTTWFTDLLTQHPEVSLGTNDEKEQQKLQNVAEGRYDLEDYRALFPADGLKRGEFTPSLMRHAAAGKLVRDELGDTQILCVLRDPIDRFVSAMRLSETRNLKGRDVRPMSLRLYIQTHAGMYADCLETWAHFLGRERITVLVYERIREDPQSVVDGVWGSLGLSSVPLQQIDRPSNSSSAQDATFEFFDGLEEGLLAHYQHQVERLRHDWGLQIDDWKTAKYADAHR